MRMIPLLLSLMLLGLAPVQAEDGPVEIVRGTLDGLFEDIDANREEYQAEPALLQDEVRDRLLPHIDTVYSGRLVLGRHGRGIETERIEEFAEAMSELLIQRFATGLLEFRSRDQVEVLPLAGDNTERMTRVRTRIRLDSGSRAPVDFVFRKRDGQWRVFDVIVEGISYVATFRNQIGEEIRRDGFDRLLERLKAGEVEIEFDE